MSKFCVAPHMTQGKVYASPEVVSKNFIFFKLENPGKNKKSVNFSFVFCFIYCIHRRCLQIEPQLKDEIEDGIFYVGITTWRSSNMIVC